MDIKENIIKTSRKKFFSSGFQKTTMDEIADELRISKKTIYKFFSSKEDLAQAVIYDLKEDLRRRFSSIISEEVSSVEKLYKFTQILFSLSQEVQNVWLEDLKIYLPNLWSEIEEFRSIMIYEKYKIIFNQGKKEEFVKERDNEIMLRILVSSIQAIINPEFILNHNFSIKSAFDEVISILMQGMLTKKGSTQFSKLNRNN